jgi:N-acylneuraminate cytidylyltransferase
MIMGQKVLGVIPARGASKGVPRKNIRTVGGRPLIAWTIEQAQKSLYIDRLIVSTEDPEINRVAQLWGCEAPFVRPMALATDDAPGIAPVLDALERISGYDWVVLLQPTSPLRIASDIDGCLELCASRNANACVSLSATSQHPYWTYTLKSDDHLEPFARAAECATRRQDLPAAYALNGAVYAARCDWLRRTKEFVNEETLGYVMPPERSLDIDTPFDIQIADLLLGKAHAET